MTGTHVQSGAEIVPEGVQFTLYSRHADAVEVCLFDRLDAPESRRVSLSRDGEDLWSALVTGLEGGQLYGFRVHGPFEPSRGHRFNPAKLLIDPRALAVTGEPPLDGSFCGSSPDNESVPDSRDTGILAPKSIVVDRTFDWQGDSRPATDWRDTILYECHVRGTSIRHPVVAEAERGTYLGLASEPVLDHLERLGITAIELLPVQQIATEPHLLRHGLPNYFGYSPLAFFAPHADYASGNLGEQVAEFKQMVRMFHRRGIEVVLDLVFNHTAEGGQGGRTLSLRGIDNRTYYRLAPDDPRRYVDFTGCGNSLATHTPQVTELLVDCLRYWVEDMHVDGFRFDLAVTLGRTTEGFSPDHPFFETIANDPRFAGTKLIAEPWDLGPRGYQRGAFPAGWLEWDDRFRDTARKVWRGDAMERGEVARLFSGFASKSTSLAAEASPGINFITCHDGFTLEDLVSYENKHNWANREENRDGHDHNLSRNWGAEGPTDSPEILKRRIRAKRNLLATMFLTPGAPMLSHGDELNRTQQGNNNAYCQDNELTWLDWSLEPAASETLTLTADLIALRRRAATGHSSSDADLIDWVAPNGRPLDTSEAPPGGTVFGLLRTGPHGMFLTLVNASDNDRLFLLPRHSRFGTWTRLLTTGQPGIRRLSHATYKLRARSISVLEFLPQPH